MENNIKSEKLEGIREKIDMELLQIQEVLDEECKKFATNVATNEAYLKGLEARKLRAYTQIGVRLVEVIQEIEEETGITFEELRFLKEYGKQNIGE